MDLHSGAAFWLVSNGLAPPPPRLGGREHCDVVIIGAGVTGALLADALSADGLDVVVLDRREPALAAPRRVQRCCCSK
jgi:NADPH-dependent 2,4-dienoyl-CoA reductase/sulfur reductase-like enzyme